MLNIVQPLELKIPFANGVGVILRPVQDDYLADLQSILNNHESADPYQSSGGYFAMTGRDGLWLVQEGSAAVVVCRHPNIRDEFLVFPSIGKGGPNLLAKTIVAVSKTGVKISLARACEDVAEKLFSSYPNVQLKRVPEKILDWAYPVHILDTAKVIKHTGRMFQQLRTELNKIDTKDVVAFDFNPITHRQAVHDIVQNWSKGEDEKFDPYMRMLDLFKVLPMSGRIVFNKGQPAGFSVWEETFPNNGLANAYAHLGLHEIEGMARFVMLDMCQNLHRNGFSKVCIGGSETAGLDQFKRQLRPVESVVLDSIQIVPAEPAIKKSQVTVATASNLMQSNAN